MTGIGNSSLSAKHPKEFTGLFWKLLNLIERSLISMRNAESRSIIQALVIFLCRFLCRSRHKCLSIFPRAEDCHRELWAIHVAEEIISYNFISLRAFFDGELVTLVFESKHACCRASLFHERFNVSEAPPEETKVPSLHLFCFQMKIGI